MRCSITLRRRALWFLLLTSGLIAGSCSDSKQSAPATVSSSVPQAAPVTTAAAFGTPADLVTALQQVWTAGDEDRLAVLVPASATELLRWGQPEFVSAPSISDCTLGTDGAGNCELLVGIDGSGLLFDMAFSSGADGGIRLDQVTFAGDAG